MVQWLAKRDFTELLSSQEKLAKYTRAFKDYFQGAAVDFTTLPMDIVGTAFQINVWEQLRKISYGELKSYSEVAEAIGKPTSVRAVASAIGKNPLLVVIPCHRVIGKNGNLTGFRSGIPLKRRLLTIEGISFN